MKTRRIRTKIAIAMLVTTICPLLLTSVVILWQVSQNIEQNRLFAQTRISEDLELQLQQYMDEMKETSYQLYSNYTMVHQLYKSVREHPGERLDYNLLLQFKEYYLNTYSRLEDKGVKGMYILDFSGNVYADFFPYYYLRLQQQYNKKTIAPLLPPYEEPTFTINQDSIYGEPIIRYLYPIKMLGHPFAVLVIDMDEQPFAAMLERYNIFANGQMTIWDHNNELIYRTPLVKPTPAYAETVQVKLPFGDKILRYEFDISPQLLFFRHFAIGIIVFSLLFSVVLGLWLSHNITKPIIELCVKMNEIRRGKYNVSVQLSTTDEIAFLGRQFNEMASRIEEHVDHELKLQLKNQESQIKALQSQISPHFLFNTLQLISNIAIVNQVPEMRFICQSLSNMYRYNIDINREWVQVKDEIAHVRNYMLIINKRLPDGIKIMIHLEPSIRNLWIPKLILQPVVENAVEHGLLPLIQGKKLMRISAAVDWQQRTLVFRVLDNGVGIDGSALQQLRYSLNHDEIFAQASGASIGLLNIQTRIKLICGSMYGIEISSKPNTGTLLTFRLPLKEVDQG
ncbi:cache domain-containing sensor histidine kinase [Paenibacillus campi]|uniref:cache domain-containing sensor histidine kinase n=1 Tax=Paenibacillus campi TaxID=3106031 RepID=UPI002B003DB4|nr:histidine kinase [Paenibacillus sp. SGZ-1014]